MRTNNICITAYFSHPIRGLKGPEATVEDMSLNNDIASMVAKMLHNFCPALDLYVPADNDEYVVESYLRATAATTKEDAEHEILEIDKIILRRRDIVIVFAYQGVVSSGMVVEIREAKACDIPVFQFNTPEDIPQLAADILNWYYYKNLS